MFFHRHRPRRDRYLPLKLVALLAGGGLGLFGMRLGSSLMVNAAIGIVLVGFLLRFLPQRAEESHQPSAISQALRRSR